MVKGKTQTGFEYSYKEILLSDMRFLDELVATEQGGYQGIAALTKLTSMMLGEDGKERLYKHLEEQNPDHVATIDAVRAELVDMINGAGSTGKN